MSNQRSVMTEFRFLDQKRQAEGLSAEEANRYAQLRELVGPETGSRPRSGFDVNAAAARLKESLLPAGLRARPAELDAPPPAPVEPPPPERPAEALALEQAWAAAPFAELTPEAADPLFDPGSLSQEAAPQAWNPEAPGYDPNAPYDEAAWIAAGYDPTATYDWSAYGYGPDGQPLAADAPEGVPAEEPQPLPEVAEGAWAEAPAPAAEQPWDDAFAEPAPEPLAAAGGEQPWDAQAAEPDLQLAEEPPADPAPGAAQGWDQAEQVETPWEEALQGTPATADLAGEAAPAAATEGELPFDPNAPFDHAKWFGRSTGPEAADELQPPADPAFEPALELAPEPALEATPEPAQELTPEPAQELTPEPAQELTPEPAQELTLEPALELALEPTLEPELLAVEADLSFELAPEPAAPAAPSFGDYDDTGAAGVTSAGAGAPLEPEPAFADLVPGAPAEAPPPAAGADGSPGWFDDALTAAPYEPAPAGAPFGEYDETAVAGGVAPAADSGLESLLPFDPAAASAIESGAMPEGYEPGGPAIDLATLPPAELGGYDDGAAFPAEQSYGGPEGDSLPGGAPLDLGAATDWQPEAALAQGFELASDGSFGQGEPPPALRTPAWGTVPPQAPDDGWESAPALDLAGPFEAPALTPAQPMAAWAPPPEELPTIDGAELLEELPPEAISPDMGPAEVEAALELEPAPPDATSSLDGAFDQADAVEAAAYPPPDLADATPAWAQPIEQAEVPAPAWATEIEPPTGAPPAWADEAPAAPEPAAPARAWEPEPALSYEQPAAEAGLPPEIAAAYGGASTMGDPFDLPPAVASGLFEPPPAPEPEPMEVEPEPPPAASVIIDGTHRVVLHTVDGQVKRGLLVDAYLDAAELLLQPQGPGASEVIPSSSVKAIFFMLAAGEKAPAPEGKKVRVTFRDGRQVAGFSPNYQEGLVGFFMIPADTRTNTGRIWVYQAAVKQVAVS